MLAEPALTRIKLSMLEEIPTAKALRTLGARTLGFSHIRLLPKAKGMRPIVNLRRRVNKIKDGKSTLGRSINSVIQPIFSVLNYIKKTKPTCIGSALLSIGDMYTKMKRFRRQFTEKGQPARFYFAKCDVQACFDRLPQRLSVTIAKQLMEEDEYHVCRHAEIRAVNGINDDAAMYSEARCARRYVSRAQAVADFQPFCQLLKEGIADGKRNTIFVDSVGHSSYWKDKLLKLLEEHVQQNMLKIGKKFYRQKAGIPQGSVLSNLLCNFVYAGFETDYLSFLRSDQSILLRLVDDFLLITTNESHAKKFLGIMHAGVKEYGVQVNPSKSVVNFETVTNGCHVPMEKTLFPYCGNLINTKTLEITKDRQRRKQTGNAVCLQTVPITLIGHTVIADSLTVELCKMPGRKFHVKALKYTFSLAVVMYCAWLNIATTSAFKIQTHKLFLDTTFNSMHTVLSTIYQNFLEAAMKYYRYGRCMAKDSNPSATLLIRKLNPDYLSHLAMASKARRASLDAYRIIPHAIEQTDQLSSLCHDRYH